MTQAYIVQALRTAGGRRNGILSGIHPADLGAAVLNALVEKSAIDPQIIDDVIVGCVTQAGEQSFALARNMILASNLPDSIPGVTIDRQCGSSQQALHFAAQAVMSGTQDVVIAAGVESMSRVPMFSNLELHKKAGIGTGPFSQRIKDRYGVKTFSQFTGAQMMADKYGFNREQLDQFALESHLKAIKATEAGVFDDEIVPVAVEKDGQQLIHTKDEGIRYNASLQSIAAVEPLQEGGAITAANASQICDGAAGLLVVNEKALQQYGLTPLARVHHLSVTAGDPVIMLEEPISGTQAALKKAGMAIDDIDLYEVNEAFASVPLAWLQSLGADPQKLNIHGGAIALGHPLGASGAKLMATLIHALRRNNKRWGLQTMCEGGGIANMTIVERL
ncbi:MAG: acetyl-CoA C-acetyltransferase [Porticoccaceae bacterium]|nr:acetyl-CoA C-acetyltransferase [Porticoccaceae bacterium]